ncbi:flavin reductase family protein [Micromonospora chersina]|uniref:flavin reductase family protein n=1 Tax=Micromonospora chersina TaxID=47854 RepID=UPI0033D6A442
MTTIPEPDQDVLDAALLRRAFAAFATGVTVVTVGGPNPHGMTANSFTSVSLDPPLLLVCVDREAVMHTSLMATRHFAVSVLAAHQEDVARHFANRRRPLGAAQFEPVDWQPGPASGAPLISDALATFECEHWRTYDGGDHSIVVGRLLAANRRHERDPVLFMHGRFRRMHPLPTEVGA